MDIKQKRKRSNALHAESSEEYLNKLEQQDTKKPTTYNSQKSMSFDDNYRAMDFDFDFDFMGPTEPEEKSIDLPILQQYHRILVVSDELNISHKLINQIIDKTCQTDDMTNSTADEFKPFLNDSDCILPLDIYLMRKTDGAIQHIFQFWIQNSFTHKQVKLFESIYYPLFEALVHFVGESDLKTLQSIEQTKKQLRADIQLFELKNNPGCLTEKFQINESNKLSVNCCSFSEVMDKMMN